MATLCKICKILVMHCLNVPAYQRQFTCCILNLYDVCLSVKVMGWGLTCVIKTMELVSLLSRHCLTFNWEKSRSKRNELTFFNGQKLQNERELFSVSVPFKGIFCFFGHCIRRMNTITSKIVLQPSRPKTGSFGLLFGQRKLASAMSGLKKYISPMSCNNHKLWRWEALFEAASHWEAADFLSWLHCCWFELMLFRCLQRFLLRVATKELQCKQ